MKYTPINLIGGYYSDESRPWSVQDTQNWLPVLAEQDGTRTPTMLRTPPGLKPFCAIGVNDGDFTLAGPVRGTYNAEGRFFAVAGNTLFQITTTGVSIPLGPIPGNSRVSFSHNQIANGNEILIVNGNSGYIYNTVTTVFQRITDTGFPGSSVALFLDNYFIGIEPRGRYAFNSDLADGLNYNALDRFTSEVSPDLIVTGVVSNNELLLLSSTTGEFFENTGATQQPFRSKRITMQKGAAGPYVAAVMDNTVFWLADDGVFYRLNGYTPERISTKPIEQAIRGLNWRQAFAFVWEDSGHAVCYWTFPDGRTWGYDAANGVWHRRQSQDLTKWRINSLTFWQQKWYAGDFQRGHLWELDWDYILEGEDEIERERVTQVVHDNQNLAIINRLELIMDTGQPITEPVPFEDQPEGPAITGDAPDGAVQNPYTPYNYTATGGTPAYRFSLRPGSVLPAGLSLSAAGQITGTPTAVESKTFTVRVTDANGLYDDLEDTITIAYSMLAIRDRSVAAANYGDYLRGGNGTDWGGAWVEFSDEAELEPVHLIGSGTHIIAYALGGNPRYTTDYGETWQDSGGDTISTSGGVREHCEFGATILIAGGTQTMARSTDRGITFTNVAGSPLSSVIAGNADLLVSIYTAAGLAHTSTDEGLTWVAATSCPLFASTERCGALFNGRYYFGGAIGAPTTPGLVSTEDGAAWSTETLPAFAVNAPIACAQVGLLDDEPTLVIITEEGEIAYFDPADDTFKLANDVMGVPTMGLTYNGAIWAAIGSDNTTGVIKYSQNVLDWTTGVSTPTAGVQAWIDIASMGAT